MKKGHIVLGTVFALCLFMAPAAHAQYYDYNNYNYGYPYDYSGYNSGYSYSYPSQYGGYGSGYGTNPYASSQQYYPYSSTYQNADSYPRYAYSSPAYDPSYASFSGYYTNYPYSYGQYTGNSNLFGTPLCNWGGGYNGYACDRDPHQWVYDPYTSTWY